MFQDTEDVWYSDDPIAKYPQPSLSEESIGTSLEPPEWWSSAIQRIAFLLDLPENWDSYGAKIIDKQVAYYSVQILQQISRPGIPAPSIVPTAKGNLQFEWHVYGIDLEFEVISPTLINVSFEDDRTGAEWERDLDYNLTPLSEVIKLLLSRTQETEVAA